MPKKTDSNFNKAYAQIKASEPTTPNLMRKEKGDEDIVACSGCFKSTGLQYEATRLGKKSLFKRKCSRCGALGLKKIDRRSAAIIAYRYYVLGSFVRTDFGGAPRIVFNEYRKTEEKLRSQLGPDVAIFEDILQVGFFEYGPRLWMIGEIEPLRRLQADDQKEPILERILKEYPVREFDESNVFFRLRSDPKEPSDPLEYDSPPDGLVGGGRFDDHDIPVLYASADLQTCIHECRVSSTGNTYVATLYPARVLKLLDLTHHLQENVTEFESLDLSLNQIFLAGNHSYGICRSIARKIKDKGLDGFLFPSHFSLLRTGSAPMELVVGLSSRKIPQLREYEANKFVPNIGLIGHPIANDAVHVRSIDKIFLEQANYRLRFGNVETFH